MLSRKETYKLVLDRVLSLPEKKLGNAKYYREMTDCYCALGAVAPDLARKLAKDDPWLNLRAFESLTWEEGATEFRKALKDLDLQALKEIQSENDEPDGAEDRYVRMVEFLRRSIEGMEGE